MANYSTIDEYLADLPEEQRRALSTLRAQINAAAPEAEEYIGYGLAGFKVGGRPLIYIGAAKNHCAIYGGRDDDALAEKLKAFKQSKGTIQFTPDKPIPAALVKEIVKARLAALNERVAAKKKPSAAKKSAPQKRAAKKSASQKAAAKKSASQNAAAKKGAAQKSAPQNAAAKKGGAKDSAAKKGAAKKRSATR
ncbi:MAG TPA: DUF1801 domain-containing protein [Polyangiales bacterium]|nr:DUF1801 domain-containing protein [Polyangiales bacterium]